MGENINISIGGKWHFYDIVAAADQLGELNHFYTTVYFKNRMLVNSPFGRKLHLSNRSCEYFSPDKVVSNFVPEIYPKALQKLHVKSEGQALRMRCDLFDNWTNKAMDFARIFHSQDGFCLETAKRMKKEGAVFICDRGIISASYLKQLSEQEYGKFGIEKEYADCFIMDKTHEEHMLADCIVVPTETVRKSLVAEGVDESKICIVPYGVDLQLFDGDSGARNGEEFKLLFVGEISFRKGCHYLLDAWNHLKLDNAELVLIGHVEKEFEVFLNQYDGKDFRIISYISQTELVDYYRNATAFILPSLAEGSARVIYEAMACSLPVIYTDMAGSIARNEIDGLEIPAFNREAIEEAILQLYKNRELGHQMGNSGHEWVKNYSKENYRKRIQDIYRQYL